MEDFLSSDSEDEEQPPVANSDDDDMVFGGNEGMGIKQLLHLPQASSITSSSVLSVQPNTRAKVQLDCHAQQIHALGSMQALLRANKFCDVMVIVDDTSFLAHAIVLAAASDYLRDALEKAVPPPLPLASSPKRNDSASVPGPTQKGLVIEIGFDQKVYLQPAGFHAVLWCFYSGKLLAEEDSIPSILYLVTKLMLPAIRSACVAHLILRITEGNMAEMLALGEKLGCSELIDASKAAMRKQGSRFFNKLDIGWRTSEDGNANINMSAYDFLAKGAFTKVPWNQEEDDQILELVTRFGVKSWKVLEVHIPGRTGKQIRER